MLFNFGRNVGEMGGDPTNPRTLLAPAGKAIVDTFTTPGFSDMLNHQAGLWKRRLYQLGDYAYLMRTKSLAENEVSWRKGLNTILNSGLSANNNRIDHLFSLLNKYNNIYLSIEGGTDSEDILLTVNSKINEINTEISNLLDENKRINDVIETNNRIIEINENYDGSIKIAREQMKVSPVYY